MCGGPGQPILPAQPQPSSRLAWGQQEAGTQGQTAALLDWRGKLRGDDGDVEQRVGGREKPHSLWDVRRPGPKPLAEGGHALGARRGLSSGHLYLG